MLLLVFSWWALMEVQLHVIIIVMLTSSKRKIFIVPFNMSRIKWWNVTWWYNDEGPWVEYPQMCNHVHGKLNHGIEMSFLWFLRRTFLSQLDGAINFKCSQTFPTWNTRRCHSRSSTLKVCTDFSFFEKAFYFVLAGREPQRSVWLLLNELWRGPIWFRLFTFQIQCWDSYYFRCNKYKKELRYTNHSWDMFT
jgi:hypothetical protein